MKYEVNIRVDDFTLVIEADERSEAEYEALEILRSCIDSRYQVSIREVK